MNIGLSSSFTDAASAFVITLDQHPLGALALIAILLAIGACVRKELASRSRPADDHIVDL